MCLCKVGSKKVIEMSDRLDLVIKRKQLEGQVLLESIVDYSVS